MSTRLLGILALVLFAGGIDRPAATAQKNPVVVQRVDLVPMVMGTKLSGDKECKYFLLTFYGDPKPNGGWIGFGHKNGSNKTESESAKPKDLKIIIEDTPVPYATRRSADNIWTIHISQADYNDESDCLQGIPVSTKRS